MELKTFLSQKPHLQEYLYKRGFLITNKEIKTDGGFPFYSNWNCTPLGVYNILTHRDTAAYTFKQDEVVFFLVGHSYNPFTMEHDEIAQLKNIAEQYKKGTKAYEESISELTGIFVTGFVTGGEISFTVDPGSMQSLYYGNIDGSFYLTSHAQLVGDLCSLKMSELAKELVAYKWYKRVMGCYLPADMTPFDELKRAVTNIFYTSKDGKTSHRRFYPLENLTTVKDDEEYSQVIKEAAEILKSNMELVLKKWSKPYISLTGGVDSNTTFAAANGMYDKVKTFSYLSAPKELIDVEAAEKIAKAFSTEHTLYTIPDEVEDYEDIKCVIEHNNAYVIRRNENEYRKRAYLIRNIDCDVEIKSWVSETIRCYWYKHYGRKSMPKLSPKLFRNLYKIFITNRSLAKKVDAVFKEYIEKYEYSKIPSAYPPADMHYNEVTWGSWGSVNISEMKLYSDITIIYNNRKFLDLLFRIPIKDRISDEHHMRMKAYLNKELADMNIRIVNKEETAMRAFLLNVIFTINSILPF